MKYFLSTTFYGGGDTAAGNFFSYKSGRDLSGATKPPQQPFLAFVREMGVANRLLGGLAVIGNS